VDNDEYLELSDFKVTDGEEEDIFTKKCFTPGKGRN
jgi:hypothetical protein